MPNDHPANGAPGRAELGRRSGGVTVICLHGEMDISTRAQLTHVLGQAALPGGGDVVVDAGQATFLDGGTIGALMRTAHDLKHDNRRLTVVNAPAKLRRIIQLAGAGSLVGNRYEG
jgi:anti-anti-sigma factor